MLLKQTSILIVDDNIHARKLLRQVLTGFGCQQLWEAPDAADAFSLLGTHPVDLAFVDYQMDGLSGAEFTKLVRVSPDSPNRFLPVIMVTSYSDRTRIETAIASGVDEFLVKPISAAELLKRIRAVSDQRRPFVRTPTFFGPDRRRRDDPNYRGPKRRAADHLGQTQEMI